MKIRTKIFFCVATGVSLVVTGILGYGYRDIKSSLVDEEYYRTLDLVYRGSGAIENPAYYSGAISDEAARAFASYAELLLLPSIDLLKIWGVDESLRYSSAPGAVYGTAEHRTHFDEMRTKRSPVYYVEGNDELRGEYFEVLTPLYHGGEMVGILELHVHSENTNRLVRKIVLITGAIVVIGALIALVLIFIVLTVFLSHPARELENAMRRIEQGDLSTPITARSSDEIGRLAHTFERMRAKLQGSIAAFKALNSSLENEIEARTREVMHEHALFLSAIASIRIGFIAFDREGRSIALNPAAIRILGIKTHTLTADSFLSLFPVSLLRSYFEESLRRQMPHDIEDVALNGRIVRIFISPVLSSVPETSAIGVSIVIEDVTEERRLDRSRDEFFSIASHELRTPLTAIRGNASILTEYYFDKVTDPEAQEMVKDILSASERLIRIINDFLSVSRLEQKKITFKKIPCDVAAIIIDVLNEYRLAADAKGLTLSFTPPAGATLTALADPEYVKEIIAQLVGNALAYTDRGSVSISTALANGKIKIAVQDTGIGIPREQQHLLFRKFQQASRDILTRRSSQGTGLGLYIARMMAESMGGDLWLESSEPGKGSVFCSTFPAFFGSPVAGGYPPVHNTNI